MKQPRDELLSGAGLAANQHGRICIRDAAHDLEDLLNPRIMSEERDRTGRGETRAPALAIHTPCGAAHL
jgi:hypothetical protein